MGLTWVVGGSPGPRARASVCHPVRGRAPVAGRLWWGRLWWERLWWCACGGGVCGGRGFAASGRTCAAGV